MGNKVKDWIIKPRERVVCVTLNWSLLEGYDNNNNFDQLCGKIAGNPEWAG